MMVSTHTSIRNGVSSGNAINTCGGGTEETVEAEAAAEAEAEGDETAREVAEEVDALALVPARAIAAPAPVGRMGHAANVRKYAGIGVHDWPA
jgi:hypothetical protein